MSERNYAMLSGRYQDEQVQLKEEGKADMAAQTAYNLPCVMDTSAYILIELLEGAELKR